MNTPRSSGTGVFNALWKVELAMQSPSTA
jgi:hypothetical protein